MYWLKRYQLRSISILYSDANGVKNNITKVIANFIFKPVFPSERRVCFFI